MTPDAALIVSLVCAYASGVTSTLTVVLVISAIKAARRGR